MPSFKTIRRNIKAGVLAGVRSWVVSLSFRTGMVVAAICVACYLFSFVQFLLPLPAVVKGILWVIFFGLTKAAQYAAILILGKAGVDKFRKCLRKLRGRGEGYP